MSGDHHGHHDGAGATAVDLNAPSGQGRHGDTAMGHHGDRAGMGHAGHAEMYRDRLWVAALLTVPILLTSATIQDWFGFELEFPGSRWVPPLLGTVVFLYGGWVFLRGGWAELTRGKPGMMALISLAIVVAYASSLASEAGLFDLEFWWELALLIVVMLFGHWQEMRAIGQARGALQALAELLPDRAEVLRGGEPVTVAIADLAPGDVVLVRPGARVPADGVITLGRASVDQSMITGESNPVSKAEGDGVVAGTVATDSSLQVQVEATGEDTALAGIQRMVAEAQSSRSRAQTLADRAAALLFYVAIGAAAVTAAVWLALGEPDSSVVRTVSVLVIACPHALGLAIPLVIALSTALSARAGILVKDRLALEQIRLVDTVLFDKTGTLTKGSHRVSEVAAIGEDGEMLRLAAAAEAESEHPLARAIVAAAARRGLDVPAPDSVEARPGRGVEAVVGGHQVLVGGTALLAEAGLAVPAELGDSVTRWKERGAAVVYVAVDGNAVGAIALEDEIRPESRTAVDELHRRSAEVALITGDSRHVAETVAAELGIDIVRAEVLPEDKDSVVQELRDQGRVVAMVGDGVNDAPALARADVGIAIGAGTDVAIESADIVLASDDPRGVVSAMELSRAGYRKMVQNLWWAAGYNIAAIPLAAGVLAPIGFTLPPALGALAMSGSTIIVAANAQLLRRMELRPQGERLGR